MTKEEILDALKAVKYPPYNKDIVSFGMVKYVKIDGKKAEIKIFTGGAEDTAKKVVSDSAHELSKKFPDCEFNVSLLAEDPSKKQPVHAESSPEGMSGAKFTIAVASGKGGGRQKHCCCKSRQSPGGEILDRRQRESRAYGLRYPRAERNYSIRRKSLSVSKRPAKNHSPSDGRN